MINSLKLLYYDQHIKKENYNVVWCSTTEFPAVFFLYNDADGRPHSPVGLFK